MKPIKSYQPIHFVNYKGQTYLIDEDKLSFMKRRLFFKTQQQTPYQYSNMDCFLKNIRVG